MCSINPTEIKWGVQKNKENRRGIGVLDEMKNVQREKHFPCYALHLVNWCKEETKCCPVGKIAGRFYNCIKDECFLKLYILLALFPASVKSTAE